MTRTCAIVSPTAQHCGELPGGLELSAASNTSGVRTEVAGDGSTLRIMWTGVFSVGGELTADVNVSIAFTAPGTASLAASVAVAVVATRPDLQSTGACVAAVSLPNLNRLILRDRRDKLFVPHFFGHEGDLSNVCGGGDCTVSLAHNMVMEGEFGMMPNGNERAMQFMAVYSTRTTPNDCGNDSRSDGRVGGDRNDGGGRGSGGGGNTSGTSRGDSDAGDTTDGGSSSTSPPLPQAVSCQPLGIYIAAHDPRASVQALLVEGGYDDRPGAHDSFAALRWLHFPTDLLNKSGRFSISYPVVVAALEGDWWDASQRYRAWALKEASWTRAGDLASRSSRPGYPAWLLRTPLWAQSWGPMPQAPLAPPVVELRRLLRLDEIGLHWYGWNTEVFDTMYPQYTPREGFDASVAELQGQGVHVVPYTNGRLFDPRNPDWLIDNASLYACGDASGTLYGEKYESDAAHNFTFRVMDPSSKYWQSKVARVVAQIANSSRVHGVYIDQIASYYAEPCRRDQSVTSFLQSHHSVHSINKTVVSTRIGANVNVNANESFRRTTVRRYASHENHQITFGGGAAWASGEAAVLERAIAESGVMIISESNAEAYLGSLHAYLALYGWRSCGFVPAFQSVYGGWSVNVGMMGWSFADPVSVRAYLALQFAWGHVLGWFDAEAALSFFQSSMGDLVFARQLLELKQANAAYLTFGRMLRPPTIVSPPSTVTVHTEGFPNCTIPTVTVACWQSSNGRNVIVLVNHANTSANVTVRVVVDSSWGVAFAPSLSPRLSARAATITRFMDPLSAIVAPVLPTNILFV